MLEDSLKSLQLNHSSFHFILQFSFTILIGAKLKSLSSQQEQMFLVRKQYMKLKWNNIFKEMLNQYDNDVAFLFSSFHPRRFFQVVIIWILLHTFIEPGILQVSSNWQCVHMMANAWHFFGHFLKPLMPSQLPVLQLFNGPAHLIVTHPARLCPHNKLLTFLIHGRDFRKDCTHLAMYEPGPNELCYLPY